MKQLFFVYGTLKAGHDNHRIIEHETTKSLGEFTTPAEYRMYDGGFPVVERGGDTAIQGELYLVEDEDTRASVFSLEGCVRPEQALRATKNLEGGPTEHHPRNWYDFDYLETPHGKAIIFVMDKGKSRRTNIVESGKWK